MTPFECPKSAKRMLMWRQMDAKRMLTWRLLDAQNYKDLNFSCLLREGFKKKKKILENSNKRGGVSEGRFSNKKKKTCAKNTWNCLKTILRQTCFFQLWPPLPPPQTCPDMSTDWSSEIKQRKAITWSVGIKKITHIIQNSFHGA